MKLKNKDLQELLTKYPSDAEVKVRAAIVVPDDLEDASEDDEIIEDGEVLDVVDDKSVMLVSPNEVHIVADKGFD